MLEPFRVLRASKSDAAGLLRFTNALADAMHKHGLVVSIDASPCTATSTLFSLFWSISRVSSQRSAC